MMIYLLFNFLLWYGLTDSLFLNKNIKRDGYDFKLHSSRKTYHFSQKYTEQLLQ